MSEGRPALSALHVTSNFTFLTGASRPEELVRTAAMLGYHSIAITDVNTLAGVVRAHVASREAELPLLVGCRIVFELPRGSPERSVLVYPTDRASYGRLSRLLTIGKRRTVKGSCELAPEDLFALSEGLLAVALPPEPTGEPSAIDADFEPFLGQLREVFDDDRLSLAAALLRGPDDRAWLYRLKQISERSGVPLVATGDVHYHIPERRHLQDVLVCIRERCTLDEAGFRLFPNATRTLIAPVEFARLFEACPTAVERTVAIAERATQFSLSELSYEYPDEVSTAGETPMESLRILTERGALERYPGGVSDAVRATIEHEMELIAELEYAPYFLTVYDLVRFARSRGILCQGRGAAANSAVCYCLGVTAVDPSRIDLLFERFVSKERDEPPDIDIDFEHERREEVIQYIYRRYGRDRAALTAEVISYRGRSAMRDVGKALGLSLDAVDRLAKELTWWTDELDEERVRALGFDPQEPTFRRLLSLVHEIQGFPRHLSQHVGGFVITRGPLCDLVPIENAAMPDRTVIEWDKDDIDAMGMLKVDCLGLGMLSCVRKAFDLTNAFEGTNLELHTVPAEDPKVYDMLCEADTVGVFQIESRAQMSMLPRLRPRTFYDLVIEVAIVRPGPIQGGMVHPYLRRRNGEEPVTYPSQQVRKVLAKTLGVPLFQEQVMSLAVVAAGFSPGEADELRRAMGAWRKKGDQLEALCRQLIAGMCERGYSREFAERLKDQIKGFGEYGFPESHAASFALIVYISAWLKCHHPAAFAAALINSQPMGFYAPAQIVRDAREHGVEVRPVDVNASHWDCTLERRDDGRPALRLGMRLVKGLRQVDAECLEKTVSAFGTSRDVDQLHRRSGVRAVALRRLAYADAFASFGLDRQAALWAVRALRDETEPSLWAVAEEQLAQTPALPSVSDYRRVLHDYSATHLSLKAHPMEFLRDRLKASDCATAAELRDEALSPHGRTASVAGVVLSRQRPMTANGILFVSLEDETGVANLIVREDVFDRYREAARHATALLAHGRVERAGSVVHILVKRLENLNPMLEDLRVKSRDFH